jgi:putative membrane protein
MTRWLLAALHLLALGIGLGSVWARSRAFRGPFDAAGFKRLFAADSWWGLAALLWISTGLTRLLGGFEKGTSYYLTNHLFMAKMGLLVLIILLELAPMISLIKWRILVKKGQQPDTTAAARFATISLVQALLVIAMVIAATGMARGYGAPHLE